MQEPLRDRIDIKKVRFYALAIGAGALLISSFGFYFTPDEFLPSYLVAFMLCLGFSLGSLGLIMLHNLVGGGWGIAINRTLRSAVMLIPLMALLFLPILFNLEILYPWAREVEVVKSEIIQDKIWYLNVPSFIVRAVVFFGVWCGLVFVVRRLGHEQEKGASLALRRWSAGGLIAYVLALTFAVF